MRGTRKRIVERAPSIGRGQILSAEDAPARIDAGIELELGPAQAPGPLPFPPTDFLPSFMETPPGVLFTGSR